jgi:hypothetical protein
MAFAGHFEDRIADPEAACLQCVQIDALRDDVAPPIGR